MYMINQLCPILDVDCYISLHHRVVGCFGQGRIQKKMSEGVLGTRRRRRRGRVAAGDETETPKASRGVENGEGCPPPQPTSVSSPSGVRSGAPAENGFGALYSCQKTPRSNHFEYFEVHVFH